MSEQTCANCTINGSVNCPTHRHNSPLLPHGDAVEAARADIIATVRGRSGLMASAGSRLPEVLAQIDALILAVRQEQADARPDLQKRFEALYADSMIAHRWFEKHFGEAMNGRDFAVKCAMADARPARTLTPEEIALIRRAVRQMDYGALHCRYCTASSASGWNHAEHCIYEQRVKDAEEARKILDALLSGGEK